MNLSSDLMTHLLHDLELLYLAEIPFSSVEWGH